MPQAIEQQGEQAPFIPAAPPFSPARLLSALKRLWWIPLIAAILPAVGAYYYARQQPILYVSRATAWVRGKLKFAEVGQYTEDGQTFFGTQIQLIQSDTMQERTLARLKSSQPDVDTTPITRGEIQVPRIRVSQAPKSSVFVLESTSTSGRLARAYLDALLDEFLEYKKEIRRATSGDALASVSAQVYRQEVELKRDQEKLERFQKENNIAVLEESLRGGGAQLAQMNNQIAMLKLELKLIEASAVEREAGIEDGTNNAAKTALMAGYLSSGSGSQAAQPQYALAQQQLELLLIQHEQLGKSLKPKHPKMLRLSEEIAKAEKIFSFFVNQSQQQLDASREATRLRLRSLEEAAKDLAGKVGEANRKMAELEAIRAGIARQQSFYERLLTLLQGVDLNSSMSQEDVGVLERASPARRSKSQKLVMVAGGGVAGLTVGLAIVLLIVRRDDRCDSLIDIQAQFPEPVFGQLPDLGNQADPGDLPVLRADDSRHVFVESCRSLRSSLLFGDASRASHKVILVTSAAPNEGKSTISVNLATALAQGGLKVLIIDADLRRGHLHKLLGAPNNLGLRECLEGTGNLDGFVVETKIPGLSLLPRGGISNSGGQMFMSPAFSLLLEQARGRYDFVILDSIPVFAADDTTTLAPKADGVLFVIRRAHTSAKLAQSALELLYQRRANVLGMVFNRADTRASSYTYYSYPSYDLANSGGEKS